VQKVSALALTDRQTEIVAANNGPTTHLLLPRQVALRLACAKVSALANAGQDTRAIQTLAGAARYTELQPTGSETSDTDRQSEIVAANNGPITHLLLPKGEKVQ
jgi:hypothetical protein